MPSQIGRQRWAEDAEHGAIRGKQPMPSVEQGAIPERGDRKTPGTSNSGPDYAERLRAALSAKCGFSFAAATFRLANWQDLVILLGDSSQVRNLSGRFLLASGTHYNRGEVQQPIEGNH